MAFFRKKPVVVEAVQLCWKNWEEVCSFIPKDQFLSGKQSEQYSETCGEEGPPWIELPIGTLEGVSVASHGDFIIKGVEGEFYACKPSIFRKSYEEIKQEDDNHAKIEMF